MARSLLRKPANPAHERLERLLRWPSLRQKLSGRKVRIFSEEHGAYWRSEAAGYTSDVEQSGVYDFEKAFSITSHCGPEKRIRYELA